MSKKNGKFIITKDPLVAAQLEDQGLTQLKNTSGGHYVFLNEPELKMNFSTIKGKYTFTDKMNF